MVMSFIEQFDHNLLQREGIYENGAIYKSYTDTMQWASGFEKKNRDEEPGTDDLQQFLDGLHLADPTGRLNFIYDNVDIPVMLDYIAANVLILDNDQVAKNFYLYCNTNDGANATYGYANPKGTNEWAMAPWDKDLTFGKDYGFADYQIPDPYAHPFFSDSDHPKFDGPVNWMVDAMLDIPEIKQMYLRRLRTLMDEYLQPPGTIYGDRYYESRFDELYAELMGDPTVESQVGDLKHFFDDIKTYYLDPRRTHLYVDHSLNTGYPDYAGIPAEQAENLVVNFGAYEISPVSGNQDQEYLTLVNPNGAAIDLSGWKLAGGIDLTFKDGVVIPAGGTLYVSPNVYLFRQRTTGPSGNQGLLVQGNYDGHLSKWGETVQLIDLEGNVVSTLTTPSNPSLAQQYLRITEVMYHPAEPTGGSYTSDDFQFIELKNISSTQTLSLAEVRFTDGIAFDFTGSGVTSLAPGSRVLVVSNQAAFQSRYGSGLNGIIAGEFAKVNATDLSPTRLAKSGEKIALVDAVGETILSFSYQDGWYKQTDGTGNSLVIRDAAAVDRDWWGRREGWFASHAANGSPGADETTDYAADAIVVNEILAHRTDEPGALGDWVEFYNATAAPIDIGGWYLSNDDADLKKFQIAAGTVVPADGYKAFNWRDNFGSTVNPGCITPFTFGELGGTAYLTSATSGALTDFQASESFGSSDTGVTLGRYIKSTGGKDFVATSSPTYEAANAPPAVGPVVIDEIYYHPTAGKDTFIELKNISGQAAPLYDPANPQNTWHLAEGVELVFPAGASIPAGGYALIVNIDPAFFRLKYNIAASVPIFGPYLYTLDKGGDTIELKYPDDPQPDGKVPYDRMDQVTYEDGGLWPKEADGFRASLNRVSAAAYGNDVANWTSGWPTPGADNAAFVADPITLTAPASATPGTVTGTTTNLAVLADSVTGASSLIYSWSVASLPAGASDPTFSVNDSNSASNATVTFGKAGNYSFTVTISNIFGSSIASSVNVTVNQTTAGLYLLPAAPLLSPGEQQQFTALFADQFGARLSSQPASVNWSASDGTITAGGLFTAPGYPTTVTITGQSGSYSGTATVQAGVPQAYWKFDETSGTSADDSSGNSYTAVVVGGCAWTPGLFGNGLNFNGSTGYVLSWIDIPETEYSVSLWFKTTSPNGGLFAAVDGTLGDNGHDRHIYLNNGNITVRVWDTEIISTTGLNLADGQWHHVVHTIGGSIGGQRIYVDGVLRASGVKTASQFDWQSEILIGFSNDASPNYFNGTIDDVRIYDSTLTAENAAYLANLPPTNITLSNATVTENQAGAAVGTLATVDLNASDTYAYVLRSDPTGKFEISGASLKLKAGQSLDFESTPTVGLTIRTYNSGGLYFDKAFTITVIDAADPMLVAAADWLAAGTAGMTLKFAADGKLHFYKTGTTIDMVTPQPPANVSAIDVTGRDAGDMLTVESMGTGVPDLAVHGATLTISGDNAISAGTNVTIDGGSLNFNGHADAIGNLTIVNNGQAAVTVLSNNTTTVASGTLTATSIVCDSLVIGSGTGAAGSANPAVASGTALTKNAADPLAANSLPAAPAEKAGNPPPAGDPSPSSFLSVTIHEPWISSIPGEPEQADSLPSSGDSAGGKLVVGRGETTGAADSSRPAIPAAVSRDLRSVQDVAAGKYAADSGVSLMKPLDHWSPVFKVYPPEAGNDDFAAFFAEKWYNAEERIRDARQNGPSPSESLEERPAIVTSQGRNNHLAALLSAIQDYLGRRTVDQPTFVFLHQNHSRIPIEQFAKFVDAVLAED